MTPLQAQEGSYSRSEWYWSAPSALPCAQPAVCRLVRRHSLFSHTPRDGSDDPVPHLSVEGCEGWARIVFGL